MPVVEFSRSLQVSDPPELVWEKLTEPQRVANWISLVGDVTEMDPLSRYSATLTDRLGPFRLSADLEVTVTEVDEPNHIRFTADGEDRQVASRIQVKAAMTISPEGDGSLVAVVGSYEVTGRVATLGASMIRSKGDKVLEEFFDAASKDLG